MDDQLDTPAAPSPQLEAPVTGDEPSAVTLLQPEGITAADRLSAQVATDAAFAAIKKQPTEKIRIPKIHGPQVVVINGARFNVPANVYVDVPQQVAEILRDAGRI